MSSATTATAADDAVTVADTAEKPQRRFPPPCWTQDETLALIEAYRERWYALRRGYLRTADWDAVAATVAERCTGASLAKTSAQCRHKMEKLRQRFRAEKQRALSFPHPGGRYFSSWFFFENMEAMENGTSPPATAQKPENSADGSRLKTYLDQNIVKLKLKSKNNDPDLGFNDVMKPKRFNSGTQIPIDYPPYSSAEIPDQMQEDIITHDHDIDLVNYGSRPQLMNAIPIQIPKPPFKSRGKNSAKMLNNFNISDGFNHQMFPAPLRVRKLENFEPASIDPSIRNRRNSNEEFWVRVPVNHNNNNNNNNNNMNKFGASLNPSAAMGGGLKRTRGAMEEIVASIKMLGEGFVRMENAKMEMAREMEAARMEMEMKRNKMLLESQKQIVDAFVKGMFELKKCKKIKTAADADSAHQ